MTSQEVLLRALTGLHILCMCFVSGLLEVATKGVKPVNDGQRIALIQKASLFPDHPYKGWSNRAGKVLTPIHIISEPCNDVYSADRQFMWFGIDVGGRCTIIELPSTSGCEKPDLWIHSPVELDDDLKRTLENIGTVKYICSPNYEHLKYATQWYTAFKDQGAQMWGCPGLAKRLPSIQWTGEIPFDYRPQGYRGSSIESRPLVSARSARGECWDTNVLQPLHLNIEKNPFNGKPFFEEVIFYHRPSKSLLTTDVFWNYPNDDGITNSQQGYDGSWELAPSTSNGVPLPTRLWKFGMDKVYKPFYQNFMITNREEYASIVDHIMNVWDIETIIPCHGDVIRGKDNVLKALKQGFL